MRYAFNTSWLMGEKVLRLLVGLFIGVWVARYLGPKDFGLLSYAQSYAFLFIVISNFGIDGLIVRDLVRDEEDQNVILGTAFYLKFFGAILIFPSLAALFYFTNESHESRILIFIITLIAIFQSFNVIDLYFQSRVLSRYVVWAYSFSYIVSSIAKIILILISAPVLWFAVVFVMDSFLQAIGLIYYYWKKKQKISFWKFKWNCAKELLKNGWPLILSGFIVSLFMKIDQIMINEMIDSEAVGQYAAAVRLSEAWFFIPLVIANSLFPAILNAKKRSVEEYKSRVQKLYTLMIWLAILIAVPISFLSDWLIKLLYGKEFADAGSVLQIHVWAGVFVFLGIASGKWLMSENLQILDFWRIVSAALFNIVLNLLLVPLYGITGAAAATFLSYMFLAYFFDLLIPKTREAFLLKTRAFFKITDLFTES